MKKNIRILMLLTIIVLTTKQTQASLYTTALDFKAPEQSFWGESGSSTSFGRKGDWGLGPFDFSYDIGASTGTVSAQFGGDLLVNYVPKAHLYSTHSLHLNFMSDNDEGGIISDLGAWAKAKALGFDLLDFDYGLNINKKITPRIGAQISGSDSATLGNTGVDVGVAEIGVDFDIEQTDYFTANSIDGILGYSLRGSGIFNTTPFNLDNSAGLSVDLGLDAVGIWDIWLMDMTLDNTFSTKFDANLNLWEEHIDGIKSCKKCKWGFCIKIPCGLDYDRNETELSSINVYNRDPFSLSFNSISNTSASDFFIRVIPEPSAIFLMFIGIVALSKHVTRKAN